MFTTGGTVTDNLAISPNDVAAYTITAPSDPRLPERRRLHGRPALQREPERVRPGRTMLIKSTKDVGDDTRVFNGVDVNFNVRDAQAASRSRAAPAPAR